MLIRVVFFSGMLKSPKALEDESSGLRRISTPDLGGDEVNDLMLRL